MPTQERAEETIRVLLPSLRSDHAAWSISPEATVADAIERMTANKLSALVVLSAQKLDGIVTQDDIREVTPEKDTREIRVNEIMTRGVYYANPDMTIDECMAMMSSRRLRHLPVLEGNRVLSMISVDDILERVARESQP